MFGETVAGTGGDAGTGCAQMSSKGKVSTKSGHGKCRPAMFNNIGKVFVLFPAPGDIET